MAVVKLVLLMELVIVMETWMQVVAVVNLVRLAATMYVVQP